MLDDEHSCAGALGRNRYLSWFAQFHKELSMAEKVKTKMKLRLFEISKSDSCKKTSATVDSTEIHSCFYLRNDHPTVMESRKLVSVSKVSGLVSVSKATGLETLNIAKKCFSNISNIQRFCLLYL